MKNLLNFLLRYSSAMLFAAYFLVSTAMLFTANPWQHHLYLTSAGKITSAVYSVANNVTGYFALRDINEDLQRRNAALELEVLGLREKLNEQNLLIYNDSVSPPHGMERYSFIVASVINNSIHHPYNYITLNRGSADGIRPEMGVVDHNGVVGIVNVTGPHTSRVISLLNPHLRLSCKVKGSEHVGSLQWDGVDSRLAILEELPRHAQFHKGDTIVTSGFSSTFPEGVPVGKVIGLGKRNDENFLSLRIRLFTDFSTLSTVRVVRDAIEQELKQVEQDPEENTNESPMN